MYIQISSSSFKDVARLAQLFIDNNRIGNIETLAFSSCPHLKLVSARVCCVFVGMGETQIFETETETETQYFKISRLRLRLRLRLFKFWDWDWDWDSLSRLETETETYDKFNMHLFYFKCFKKPIYRVYSLIFCILTTTKCFLTRIKVH